ncbi:MAG TPA: hypothetical protein DDW68_13010 [Verrucomicrobiales bacterium]|nr:hypothetical protein [Verrucomicrobiales bacterium]
MASVKRFSSPLSTFVIPVLAGLLMAWGIGYLSFMVKLEHLAFVFPKKFSTDTHLAFQNIENEKFVVNVYDISSKYSPKLNLESYTLDSETTAILGRSDLTPANWVFLINSIREAGAEHLVITQSLSWENTDELVLRAIQHELSQLESFAIGIDLQRGPITQEFPSYLEGSVIQSPEAAALDEIPRINQIGSHPSIEAPFYGFTQLENIHPDKESDTIELPLLVRWNDKLLPSLELASLMAQNGSNPNSVLFLPGKSLLLKGQSLIIIPIDKTGRTSIPLKKIKPLSSVKLLESPEETLSIVALIPENSSLQLQQFPFSIQYLDSLKPQRSSNRYSRLPFWGETAFLGIFVLILHHRKWWLSIVAALAYFVFPFSTGEWLLFSPPLTAALAFTALKTRGTRDPIENSTPSESPVETEEPVEDPEPPPPEVPVKESENSPTSKLPERHSSSSRQATSSKDRLARKKHGH